MANAREVVERWWKAFEAHDFDGALALVADSGFEFVFGGERLTDKAQLRGFLEAWLRGFPDLRHETVSWIESGNHVVHELRAVATHTGPFATPQGEVPATGKRIQLDSADVMTVENGKIKTWHIYNDRLIMMGQLGLLPQPATV